MMMQYVKDVQTVQRKVADCTESITFINEVLYTFPKRRKLNFVQKGSSNCEDVILFMKTLVYAVDMFPLSKLISYMI